MLPFQLKQKSQAYIKGRTPIHNRCYSNSSLTFTARSRMGAKLKGSRRAHLFRHTAGSVASFHAVTLERMALVLLISEPITHAPLRFDCSGTRSNLSALTFKLERMRVGATSLTRPAHSQNINHPNYLLTTTKASFKKKCNTETSDRRELA